MCIRDRIRGIATSTDGAAVVLDVDGGNIDAGSSNDKIEGVGTSANGSGSGIELFGDDVVRGFGSGTFDGGLGTDALTFNAGNYSIERVVGQRGVFQVTLASQLDSPVMTVSDFEFFGEGDQQTSFAAAVSAGEIMFA